MSSADIQSAVYDWARNRRFTAPYGVLSGTHTNSKGKTYRSITFGYARTRDYEVQIYNRNFIVLRDSFSRGGLLFKSYDELMTHLETL